MQPAGYAALDFGNCHITDFEFLDAEEIALISTYPTQGKDSIAWIYLPSVTYILSLETLLSTIDYNALDYTPFHEQRAYIEQFQEVRSLVFINLMRIQDTYTVISASFQGR